MVGLCLFLLVATITATDASRNVLLPLKSQDAAEHSDKHHGRGLKSNKNTDQAGSSRASYETLTFLGHDGPYGRCAGDCDFDTDCMPGLVCFKRDGFVPVPGCSGQGTEHVDYCIDAPPPTETPTEAPTPQPTEAPTEAPTDGLLGLCAGGCDTSLDCMPGLVCYQRNPSLGLGEYDFIPGCNNSTVVEANVNYCVDGQHAQYFETLTFLGHDGPYGRCAGDCDTDEDCLPGLVCSKRDGFAPVPGCPGQGTENIDYCIDPPPPTRRSTSPPTVAPTSRPTAVPTPRPTLAPVVVTVASDAPTGIPTKAPVVAPTPMPADFPTPSPIAPTPSPSPSQTPSQTPGDEIRSFALDMSVAVQEGLASASSAAVSARSSSVPDGYSELVGTVVQALDSLIEESLGYTVLGGDEVRQLALRAVKVQENDKKGRRKLVAMQHDTDATAVTVVEMQNRDPSSLIEWVAFRVGYTITDFNVGSTIEVGNRRVQDYPKASGAAIASAVQDLVSTKIDDGSFLLKLREYDERIIGVADVGEEDGADFLKDGDQSVAASTKGESQPSDSAGPQTFSYALIALAVCGVVLASAFMIRRRRQRRRAEIETDLPQQKQILAVSQIQTFEEESDDGSPRWGDGSTLEELGGGVEAKGQEMVWVPVEQKSQLSTDSFGDDPPAELPYDSTLYRRYPTLFYPDADNDTIDF